MGPSPTRKIQVEESNIPTARPLDAALRQPANDNFSAVDNPRPRDTAIRQQSRRAPRVTYKNNTLSQNPSYTSTDQQFNDSYAQQGLQPSVGRVQAYTAPAAVNPNQNQQTTNVPVRKVTYNTGPPVQPDNSFSSDQQKGTASKAVGSASKSRDILDFNGKKMDTRGMSFQRELTPLKKGGFNPKKALMKKLPGGSEGALKNIADRAYATEVSLSTLSWGTWVWATLQLPFAILALVFFSLAGAVEYLNDKAGVVGDVVTTIASWVGGVLTFFLGIDLSLFNPENIFMLTNAITWFIGLATLVAVGLTYALAGIPCLSGKATALKYTTLIMACVAYAIPVLNVLPWAIFWVLVVWLFPTDEAI